MPMKNTRSFWQYGLEKRVSKEPEGVCFRESFKWLACKIYGLDFKFENSNAQKVVDKQATYLASVQPYEGSRARFEPFFANVHRISLQQLNQWGNKNSKHTGRAKYRLKFAGQTVLFTLTGCQAFNQDAQMVIGLYGDTDKAGSWAHAVAFYRSGDEIVYFDANGGEYRFDPGDNIGAEIMSDFRHRRQPYVGLDGGVTYSLKKFGLYQAQVMR